MSDIVTAAVLVIGDEILSGRTKDVNIGYIADHLTAVGIQLKEVRVVSDVQIDIVDAVNALRARYDYVFTTGGIGPTHDDITADSIAAAFGVSIDVDDRALALMLPYYEKSGRELTPARLRMARIPHGADLIENSVSVAPGFMIGNVIVMAGVPKIMQVMLDAITPHLRTGRKLISRTVPIDGVEGDVADVLGAVQAAHPDVSMGSYPQMTSGKLSVQIVLRCADEALLDAAIGALGAALTDAGIRYALPN